MQRLLDGHSSKVWGILFLVVIEREEKKVERMGRMTMAEVMG